MIETELLADNTTVTHGFLASILHKLGAALGKQIEKSLAPSLDRIVSIETRCATIETRNFAMGMLIARAPNERTMLTEFEVLIARVKALEERPTTQYCGVWTADNQYARGSLATHGGSVWHANKTTRSKPGESDHWTLAVKHGRDAR